jgi:hypothetical protein
VRRRAPPEARRPIGSLGPAGRAQKAQLERRLGRPIREPSDDGSLDRLEARARQLDREAFAEPRPGRRMERRRVHAWALALDEYLAAGDPVVAAALVGLAATTRH